MTSTAPLIDHADLQRTITDAARDICDGFRRDRIPIEASLAIVTYVLGLLTDQLPADQRASFLRAFAKDLRRTPRRDA
jgi:hypothetical protein